MAIDKSLIDALLKAVENDPDSSALRLHLADSLAQNKAFEAAMEQVNFVLRNEPANKTALGQAADVCEKLGDLG